MGIGLIKNKMQNIQLTDKRTGKTTGYTGAEKWGELTTPQFLAVMRAKSLLDDPFKQAVVLAQVLFDIPLELVQRLTTVQATQLAGVVTFVFEGAVEIDQWHLTHLLRRGKSALYGPSETLGNICFGELMFADLYLRKYQKTKDLKDLDFLVAILYREGDGENRLTTGDTRNVFNKNLVEEQAKQLASIKEVTKQAVLVNYIGCRAVMAKSFPNVFPQRKVDEVVKESRETWLDVGIQLARKEHALGTIAEVEATNAWLVLKVLDKVIGEVESKE